MKDKQPARRKRKNLFRQIAVVGTILTGTFLTTLLAVPRLIVLPTSTFPSIPTSASVLAGRTMPTEARGNIYDRHFKEMAVSFKSSSIVTQPLELTDPLTTAAQLAAVLGPEIDQNQLALDLRSEERLVTIARNIDPVRAGQVTALDLPGIRVIEEMVRCYPQQRSAAHLLGYVEEGKGLEGVEYQYNNLLRGGAATATGQEFQPLATSGAHLVLSVDSEIQAMIEKQLTSLLDSSGSDGGTALLLDPRDGSVLALVSLPTFDPGNFSKFRGAARRNRVLADRLPLGSLNDIFQLAAALDRDHRAKRGLPTEPPLDPNIPLIAPLHRKLPLAVQQLDLDDATLVDFGGRLGFGLPPAIDLPLFTWDNGTADVRDGKGPVPFRGDSFFRGTTLELGVAFSALVNGGRRITPRLIAELYDLTDGQPLPLPTSFNNEELASLRVMDGLVSHEMQEILAQLGRSGPADSIFFETVTPEGPSAGSTDPATASQLARSLQQGDEGKTQEQAVLFGFMPAAKPEILLVMTLSHPDPAWFDKKHTGPSPLLSLARQTLPRAKEMADTTVKKTFAELSHNTEVFPLNRWKIEQHSAIGSAMAQESDAIQMPDVLGKSLRNGLQILQHYNLRIRVVGTGRIVNQHPEPQAMLPAGEECILHLNLDN